MKTACFQKTPAASHLRKRVKLKLRPSIVALDWGKGYTSGLLYESHPFSNSSRPKNIMFVSGFTAMFYMDR